MMTNIKIGGIALCVLLLLQGCTRPTVLEKIEQEGVLHIVTRNGPTTFYEGRDGLTGFEYELAKLFADDLGVELRPRSIGSLGEMFTLLDQNFAHFAAAGLTVTPEREQRFRFGPRYFDITQQVVYRVGTGRPRSPEDLVGKRIRVLQDSSHSESLRIWQQQYPELTWSETADEDVADLLKMVADGEIDYTVVDSNELSIQQAFFSGIARAFDLTEPEQLAWAFPSGDDTSLMQRAEAFFQRIEADGTLNSLQEKHYGHVKQLNYVGAKTFMRHVEKRLGTYQPEFESAAQAIGEDWRLLAAVGYQESNWRRNAVSPTGVRGLMMLTLITAKEMGVANRLDPIQSIHGGARYYDKIKARIPDRITEPDRTWLALAAYNVGLGHLEDARIITEQMGKNPDKWIDVKEHLPLLQKRAFYKHTKHGYARGMEPVIYVQNIRRYYEVLRWITQPEAVTTLADDQTSDAIDLPVEPTSSDLLDIPPIL